MANNTPEIIDDTHGELIEIAADDNVLKTIISAETDLQISTAKQYPRSIKEFVRDATELVTMDDAIALESMYSLPRGGKAIEGPSVRFAEILASCWGNCRCAARVIDDGEKFVTAQGVFADLQRNIQISAEIRRRITDRRGKRYNDDMIGVTGNAACSIALRNAILRGIPKAIWRPIYSAARQVAIGDATTLNNRRATVLEEFQKMGAKPEDVFAYLEIKGAEDMNLDHVTQLRHLFVAVRDGSTTLDEAFNPPEPEPAPKRVGKSDVLDKAAKSTPKKKKEDLFQDQPNDAE